MAATNERVDQIRRRWTTHAKYYTCADPEAAELKEFVSDLLDEIDEYEDHVCEPDDPFADPSGDISWQEHDEELNRLTQEHADRLGELAPAIEELHRQAHGAGSLYMCTAKPCRSLYRSLPNARGIVLAPMGAV